MVNVEGGPCLILKTQRVRSKWIATQIEACSIMAPKTPTSSLKDKTVDDDILEELMKGIRELNVEMSRSYQEPNWME